MGRLGHSEIHFVAKAETQEAAVEMGKALNPEAKWGAYEFNPEVKGLFFCCGRLD
jgi:hypothetical protein